LIKLYTAALFLNLTHPVLLKTLFQSSVRKYGCSGLEYVSGQNKEIDGRPYSREEQTQTILMHAIIAF